MRSRTTTAFALVALAALSFCARHSCAQAALLMEEPYGFFGELNPTGHDAIYFQRICAESTTELRRCEPGETGAVISRYQGIGDRDWVAVPLVPYLYAVDDAADVPSHVDREMVTRLRNRYKETHMMALGENVSAGSFLRRGWSQLVGAAYERRIYALRFNTTEAQDDALIQRFNSTPNSSHFDLLYSNCADFARNILNEYFPGTFSRSFFPDAGMTTPKQVSWKLERYARRHPEADLAVFEIPQIPGYRAHSHSNKGVAESLVTTGYAVPIVLFNPYIAGGLFADYLLHSRYHLLPNHPDVLAPDKLSPLTSPALPAQNPPSVGLQVSLAAADSSAESDTMQTANIGLREMKDKHE